MICANHYIFITFDPDERFRRVMPGGTELVIPYWWEHVDENGKKNGKMEHNLNGLETNSQIGYVIAENPDYPFKCGDKVFFHYLSIDEITTIEGQKGAFIDARNVFFTDNNGIKMCDKTYLGNQIFDGSITDSGLYVPECVNRSKKCMVKITHIPKDSKVSVGDTVFTIDNAQYNFTYNNEPHIKLMDHEIVAAVSSVIDGVKTIVVF